METSIKNGNENPNQTGVYEELSSHLYRVLDVIGVSEEVRQGYRERSIMDETLVIPVCKVTHNADISVYICGSKYEGSTTFEMCSDTDMLHCDETQPVVENIDDAPVYGAALLMIPDDTKPGYVKLQSVFDRTKQTANERQATHREDTDTQGRIIVKHVYTTELVSERHGPADNIPAGENTGEKDHVNAYRCRNIPRFADEWLHRHRAYNWPSQEQLKIMEGYGCFLVGVGHPESRNKEIEWRVSFSLQERDLMTSLNPTQHKCYILLKMIKRDIIQPRVGKSLSSYHCKTCIFHLAESLGVELWTSNNLVSCILECLRLLLDFVRQGNCPNYFIQEENMFDKLDKSTLRRMSFLLLELLSNGVQFLYDIRCDGLGTLLTLSKSDRYLEEMELVLKQYYGYTFYKGMMISLLTSKLNIHRFIDRATLPSERASRANHILHYLEQTTVITEHKSKDVRMVLGRFLPYLHFVIVQMKHSNELAQMMTDNDDGEIQALARDIQNCGKFDLVSSKLIVASLYFQCDKLDRCQEIILDCEISLKPYVISSCGCHDYRRYPNIPLKEKIVAENLSFEEFRRECTAACMIFLPSEANLVPAALRYEMYRSVCIPPGSRLDMEKEDGYLFDWFDWIVVDSKVYLYFLQYLLYQKTNESVYKQDAIENLQHLVYDVQENLGHRETAFNLLGWIYTQENRVQDAFVCFLCSLFIRPEHNAAKWHMAMLINSQIITQTIYNRKWFQ